MQVENIAILGDSWAWGEWSFIGDNNLSTHNGTHHYLQQEYPRANVVNFARAGGSNLYQLDRIAEQVGMPYFRRNFDIAICFWTDPGRDILNKIEQDEGDDLSHFSEEYYTKRCEQTSNIFLNQLNDIGVPVFLIGGQVSLPKHVDYNDYDNLYPVVDRMSNLIDKPFWNEDINGPIKGEMTNTIDWNAPGRIDHLRFSEKFKLELQELRLKQNTHLNYTFFPDLGHGGRTLHRLASIKIIDEIGKLNAS